MAALKDPVAHMTGDFGKWQLQSVLIIFLCKIPTSWFMAVVLFSAPKPNNGDFWCRPPEHITNNSVWIAAAHPIVVTASDDYTFDFCNVYREVYEQGSRLQLGEDLTSLMLGEQRNSSDVVPCKDFVFNVPFNSVISEFGLVCGRKLLAPLAQSFHIFGLLMGGVVAFFLLKEFSPRRLMLVAMFLQIICGTLCGLVGLFELHVLFRFLTAVTCAMMYTSGQLILTDICNGRAKTMVIVLFELFWSVGLILLPAITMFFDNYTRLYLALSLPTLVLIFLHRLIPDSPRWMLAKQRIEKAQTILMKAARRNKREIPAELEMELKHFASIPIEPQVSWFRMWRGLPRKRYILCIHYAFALYIVLMNSMVLNLAAYGQKHIRMNTVSLALSEMAGVMFALYLILYTKRKWLWAGLLSICTGLFANIAWIIPSTMEDTHIIALTMLPCIFIKFTTSIVMSVLTTASADLVAPNKKKILMFSSGVWARAWFLWAPFIGATSAYGVLVPLTVFAAMSVIGGCLAIGIYYGQCAQERRVSEKAKVQEKEKFLAEKT